MTATVTRFSPALDLQWLEAREVLSVAAMNYTDGLWRYDAGTNNWAHLSVTQASDIEIDDGGNVFASFHNIGLWRWSVDARGWQKLSDFNSASIEATGGGVLYGGFGPGIGTWRWDYAGWQQLSGYSCSPTVSDADVLFGAFGGGATGIWRWTPQAGWAFLSPQLPETGTGLSPWTDDAGNYITNLNFETLNGLWRWSPSTGWARLTDQVLFNYVVSESGVIYDRRADGVYRLDPNELNAGFVRISTLFAYHLVPDTNAALWGTFISGGATLALWRYTPVTGWALLASDVGSNLSDLAAGKDHDLFFDRSDTGDALWYWSAVTGYTKPSWNNSVNNLVAEAWNSFEN